MQSIFRFLSCMVAYHLLHTMGVFGLELLSGREFALLRDLVWLALLAILVFSHLKRFAWKGGYMWRNLVLLALLLLWSLGISWQQGVSLGDMLVGIKYDVYPLFLLLSGVVLGVLRQQDSDKHLERGILIFLQRVILVFLLGWFVWQIAKIIFPDLMQVLGYGAIGDYVQWVNPPIYYRTGPGGMMRWQGLFAWPNNYGFWLVATAALTLWMALSKEYKAISVTTKSILLLTFLGAAVLTFSRGVIVGVIVEVCLLIWWLAPQYKKYLVWLVGVGVVWLVWLSLYKPGSTVWHVAAWAEWLQAFLQQPWGYGLGSAGPAVHYQGMFLPENHYLQLLLDIGLPGLFLWCLWLGYLLIPAVRIALALNDYHSRVFVLLCIGLAGLLVEWLFLHTFEDSMVTYVFLVPLGILTALINKSNR